MQRTIKGPFRRLGGLGLTLLIWGIALPIGAADGSAPWRATYDTVMMWVNFVILVALLVKLLRNPLRQFLSDQADEITRELDTMAAKKDAAEQGLADTRARIEKQAQKMEKVRDLILDQGQREKETLIANARSQARTMLNNAQQRAENRVREAGHTLKTEMVDAAFAIAHQKLPTLVQPRDQQRWLKRALKALDDV